MKFKLAIATVLIVASTVATAVEVGVNGSYDFDSSRPGAGLTVGTKFDKFGVTGGFDRYTKGTDTNKYTLVGSYDVTNIGKATIAAKAGVAYIDNTGKLQDGYAALVGAGVSYPVATNVAATVDYRYQAGQSKINSQNGSTVSAGLKYSF
jgi:opacity protein-like surface antigen